MLRRDLRQIWNSCSPSFEEKEACLERILAERTKDTDIRGIQWKPKGRLAPWLVIVLLVLVICASLYWVADRYGIIDWAVELTASVVPTRDKTDDTTLPSATEDTQNLTEPQQISYKSIAEKYIQAIEEDWDMIRLQEEDISYLVMFHDRPEDINYLITDLDGNGTEEMIISDGNVIYDLYTCSDGDIVHILSGAERDSFTLTANNEIVNISSGGAGYTVYRMYLFYGTNLIPMEMIVCDASRDPSAPWFRGIDDPENVTPISETEAREIIDMYPAAPIRGSAITMFN